MWIYNEPTVPPIRTANFPVTLSQDQVDSWVRDRMKLFYHPSRYKRSDIVICRRINNTVTIYYEIQQPANFYGGVIDLTGGKVYSFFDKDGNWLLAPSITTLRWKRHSDSWYTNGAMPQLSHAGENTYYAATYYTTYPPRDPLMKMQVQYKSEEGDMDIVTGYIGEPHITAVQDRDTNRGIFGEESYILNVGDKLAAEVVSATEIRIRDGSLCHQGCIGNITNGAYDALTISNGSQGMLRHDLIVARYAKNADTHAESLTLVVIEGEPAASSPADPAYNEGDIRDGDSPVDMPLYRVNINGVNISSITRLAPIAYPLDAPGEGTFSKIDTVTLNAQTTLHRAGNMVIFNIDASTSAAIPSGSSGNGFIVFPAGFRPATAKFFSGRVASGTVGEYYLSPNGQLQVNPQIASGTTFRVSGSFIV